MKAFVRERKEHFSSRMKLPEALNRQLSAYAIAAGAAGVAILACSAKADAAPVCKTLSIAISATNTYPLNPALQPAAPFNIAQTTLLYVTSGYGRSYWWNRGFFIPNSGGANLLLGANSWPANLEGGNIIGPGGDFGKGKSYGLMFTYGKGFSPQGHGTLKKHFGNFDLKQENYVGFVFLNSGEPHYGWARMEVTFKKEGKQKFSTIGVLEAGYESAPNTAIAAGNCSSSAQAGNDSISAPLNSRSASLGMLAAGR
jgi:hypothetical protein